MIGKNQTGSGLIVLVILAAIVVTTVAIGGYYTWSERQDEPAQASEETADTDEDTDRSSLASARTDSQIRNDVSRIMAMLENYAADNNGNYPMTNVDIDQFEANYFPEDFTHPESGLPYTVNQLKGDDYHIIMYLIGVCTEDGSRELSGERRRYVLQAELTDGERYCLDNS